MAARFGLLFAVCLSLQASVSDSAFSGIPFHEWFQGTALRSNIEWTASVSPARLSTHQRLFSRVEFKVSRDELKRRHGHGRFLLLAQVSDEHGNVWQHHSAVDLDPEVPQTTGEPFTQPFFVMPGDYTVSLAVFDSKTGDHGVLRKKLHVGALKNDPLPDAWRNLPAIEFLTPAEPPDTFFLPEIEGKLHLPVKTRGDLEIELLANLTPSERFMGSSRMQEVTMEVLLPTLKVLSEIQKDAPTESTLAKLNLEMLDLARSRVVYRQNDIANAGWDGALGAIGKTTPGIIDVKSLARHRHTADFFVREVGRRVSKPMGSGQARAVIVLTSSVTFKPGVELNPIAASAPPGLKVFYLRFQPQIMNPRHGPDFGALPPAAMIAPPEVDQLAPLLRNLNPQLYTFNTALQFRKALARVLEQIQSM